MNIYTQADLDYLIGCQKVISKPPRKTMSENNSHYHNNMHVESTCGEHRFYVFMRRLVAFQEDFSIGLQYMPLGSEKIILLRCQGPHGEYRGEEYEGDPHFDYHVHRARADNIEIGMKPERGGEYTDEYATYEGAIAYFIKACNIIGADEYFSFMHQLDISSLWRDQ